MGRDRDPGVKRGGMAGLRRKKSGICEPLLWTLFLGNFICCENTGKTTADAQYVVPTTTIFTTMFAMLLELHISCASSILSKQYRT